MIAYKDFLFKGHGSWQFRSFMQPNYDDLDVAVATANTWIVRDGVAVLNVETVVSQYEVPRVRVWFESLGTAKPAKGPPPEPEL